MMISTGINLVMTVIGFAVSTMFIVFVCTRLICARIQLRASRRNFPTASRSDLSVLERGLNGLEPFVVASFPTKEFGNHFSSGHDTQDTLCTVCLAEYQERDILRILPYCRHAFHVTCIDIWLKQHSTCPVCRISLRDSPDRKRAMQPVYSEAIRSRENFELDSYYYLYADHNYSETIEGSQRAGYIQENQFSSEQSEASEPEVDCSVKIDCYHENKDKLIESPSNT
ncbi:uncharacterized protein A4U43_C09F50 [Asparagus officinalis]|uniref:RING-type E3 ubiquitin transferase n=1 Tax=Asparagus officinalis TaxID=4686 RepID=A0A5P1E405_ASPOF|nr:RING-H2 finger protein ATL68-like [Asparagus officinalis]ONK57392.1 uncharacterized protein A4U43_C09F50 [Asparagus officinalis]